MDRKEKREKKSFISKAIDLANGRFKDDEIDILYDLVKNREKYDGSSKTYKHSFTDWSSDGKYTRDEETTFIIHGNKNGLSVEEKYHYRDDDGQSGGDDKNHTTARGILRVIGKVLVNR